MSPNQNSGRSRSVETDVSSFGRMEGFKLLGTILTNQNSIQEEIKSSLKPGNACCHSGQIFCRPVCSLKIQGLRYTEL